MAALLSYIHKNTDDITTFRSHITSLDSAMKDSFLAFVLTSEQLDLAILLIEFGIQMPHDMAQKNSLLIYAVTQENIAFAHQLIRHGADINILDQTQRALLAETSSLSTASTEIISDDDSGHPAQRAPGANGGISTEQSRRPAFILNARRTLIDTSVFAMVDSVLPAQAAIDTVMNVDPVPPTGQLRRPFTLSARGTRIDANAFESDPDSRPSSPRSAAP